MNPMPQKLTQVGSLTATSLAFATSGMHASGYTIKEGTGT